MKKSLIGLFSLAALVVAGLAACTPATSSSSESSSEEPATLLTIQAALEIEASYPYSFVYLNEKIRIEDATLTTIIGDDTAFIQQAIGETVQDLANLELQVSDWGGVDSTRQIVTVEGTLAEVNGHAVLEDAVIVEAVEDPTAGTYYWPNIQRSYLDGYFGRTWHGYWFSADVQLVDIPTTVVAGTEQTFHVVFPGEDTNLENPDNIFPLDVTIPAGITENEAEAINEWLSGVYYVLNEETEEWDKVQGEPVAAGDFVNMFAMHVYNNLTSSLIFNGSSALNTVPAEITNVFTKWASEDDKEETPFSILGSNIVDAQIFTELGSEDAYSYLVTGHDEWGVLTPVYGIPSIYTTGDQYPIVVTYYTYDVEGVTTELCADLQALNFAVEDLSVENGIIVATNEFTAHTVVIVTDTEGYVEVLFYGISAVQISNKSADAIQALEDYVSLYEVKGEAEFTSSLPEFEKVLTDNEITTAQFLQSSVYYVDRMDADEDGAIDLLATQVVLFFAVADQDSINLAANAYLNAIGLLNEEIWLNTGHPTFGYVNMVTGECLNFQLAPAGTGVYALVFSYIVLSDAYLGMLLG